MAADPARMARNSTETEDLDFTAPPVGSRLKGATHRTRSVSAPGFQRLKFRLRSLGTLVLLNIRAIVEYAVLGAGIFLAVAGRQSGSARNLVLGISLVGAALLFAGVASIVTRRVSFRFYGRAGLAYAGAVGLISGMTLLVAGGLAAAAAATLATGVWDAKLQILLTNPWPLLIPVGLLLVGAGLLLMHRPYGHFGSLGMMLYIIPKALTGALVLIVGTAILAGWAWKVYDAKAFLGFAHLFLDGNMQYLEKGWHALIAWLR